MLAVEGLSNDEALLGFGAAAVAAAFPAAAPAEAEGFATLVDAALRVCEDGDAAVVVLLLVAGAGALLVASLEAGVAGTGVVFFGGMTCYITKTQIFEE